MNIDCLIDIDPESKKIYTDFGSFEFGSEPQVKQLLWGEYQFKPVAQSNWELQVAKASEIAANATADSDFRPRIKDHNSGLFMLVDTGAAVSVFPKKLCPRASVDNSKALKAVNGSTIPT